MEYGAAFWRPLLFIFAKKASEAKTGAIYSCYCMVFNNFCFTCNAQ